MKFANWAVYGISFDFDINYLNWSIMTVISSIDLALSMIADLYLELDCCNCCACGGSIGPREDVEEGSN